MIKKGWCPADEKQPKGTKEDKKIIDWVWSNRSLIKHFHTLDFTLIFHKSVR
jgi:hypothetical protein